MKVKKYGIKGFDKNLKCRDFQYEIGKTYTKEVKPVLCREGFHYSLTIDDVFEFYKNDGSNRFCIIEVLGDVDIGVDKCCSNKIKIIEELSKSDVLKSNITPEEMSEMCSYGFVIGGSKALKFHGYKIERNTKEVDLIITKKKYDEIKNEIFIGYKEIKRFSCMDSVKCYVDIMGNKFDILISENIKYVERIIAGYSILLQDSDIIWQEKLKYALNGSLKHMNDIRINGIDFIVKPIKKYPKKRFGIKYDLPF